MDYLEHSKLLAAELEKRFGEKIDSILVFGSVARGKANKKSDIDLFIIGDRDIKNEVSKIRTEMDLKHGTLTTIVFKTKKEFEEQHQNSDFLKEIWETGVALYGTENIARA
ncbi:nucleotidyltransferase domain protein [archaeon BMS3Bbin16]|nr:nucleotidyltransferase domain protein [archaeon BMS3Bbin16]